MSQSPTIIYTCTDEAPALATRSLLPIIRAFAAAAEVPIVGVKESGYIPRLRKRLIRSCRSP